MDGTRRFEWALVGNVFDRAAVLESLSELGKWRLVSDPEELVLAGFDWTARHRASEGIEADFDVMLMAAAGSEPPFLCRSKYKLTGPAFSCLVWELVPAWFDPGFVDGLKWVLVREVPPAIMLTCSVHPDNFEYKAVFSTLAGNVVRECWLEAPPAELGPDARADLVAFAAAAAVDEHLIQSQNQKVCVMLEGNEEPVGIETVSDIMCCSPGPESEEGSSGGYWPEDEDEESFDEQSP